MSRYIKGPAFTAVASAILWAILDTPIDQIAIASGMVFIACFALALLRE